MAAAALWQSQQMPQLRGHFGVGGGEPGAGASWEQGQETGWGDGKGCGWVEYLAGLFTSVYVIRDAAAFSHHF